MAHGTTEAVTLRPGEEAPSPTAELDRLGRDDICVVVGGVVPPADVKPLLAAGASAVFGPGTVISVAAGQVLDEVERRSGIAADEGDAST